MDNCDSRQHPSDHETGWYFISRSFNEETWRIADCRNLKCSRNSQSYLSISFQTPSFDCSKFSAFLLYSSILIWVLNWKFVLYLDLRTNSMMQDLPWVNSYSSGHNNPLLYKLKAPLHHVQKSPPMNSVLSWFKSIHTFLIWFSEINSVACDHSAKILATKQNAAIALQLTLLNDSPWLGYILSPHQYIQYSKTPL